VIARPLGTCDSVLCATPDYLAQHGQPQTPQALTEHNCLTYTWFGKSLWHFSHNDAGSEVAVSGNLSANDSFFLLAATQAGAGISMQPYFSVVESLASGELQEVLPGYQLEPLQIYGIYSSRRQMHPALRALLDFLVEWFANAPQLQPRR